LFILIVVLVTDFHYSVLAETHTIATVVLRDFLVFSSCVENQVCWGLTGRRWVTLRKVMMHACSKVGLYRWRYHDPSKRRVPLTTDTASVSDLNRQLWSYYVQGAEHLRVRELDTQFDIDSVEKGRISHMTPYIQRCCY